MYIDEDGDVAHEFYVEAKEGSNLTLKQISNKHLTPQVSVVIKTPLNVCFLLFLTCIAIASLTMQLNRLI